MTMVRWHAKAIAGFVRRAQSDPRATGVILVGSAARGETRADSDVDLYLVVHDGAFSDALSAGRISYVDHTDVDDPHGYVDVKLLSPSYLREGIESGDDPLRASFVGARVLWDADGTLSGAVSTLLDPGSAYFAERRSAFAAQLSLHGGYFLRQALEHAKPLLAHHAAVHAAYAAGRIVLANDAVFFRGAKYLDVQLTAAPSTPERLVGMLTDLVTAPSEAGIRAIADALAPLVPDALAIPDEVLSRFIVDNELSWRTGTAPPEYR
jgi:predicted nucleotidyltransferase